MATADKGLEEMVRIAEDRVNTMKNAISLIRDNAKYTLTTSSLIFAIISAANLLDTKAYTIRSEKMLITLFETLIFLFVLIISLTVRPIFILKWKPGVTLDRKKMIDYFYGLDETELLNRRFETASKELIYNRDNVRISHWLANASQVVFSLAIIVVILMCLIPMVM